MENSIPIKRPNLSSSSPCSRSSQSIYAEINDLCKSNGLNINGHHSENPTTKTTNAQTDTNHFEINRLTVTPATEWHFDPDEDYPMRSSPRGLCLIINNVEFDHDVFPVRKGSDMDAFRFKSIFRQLDFVVESKRNLTSDKMKIALRQIAARCSAKHDALVVILLSHGSETGIFGKDSLEVDFNDILSYFDNKRCKQMKGKPKIFIVQACRGQQADFGVRDSQALISQAESLSFTQPSQLTQINSQSPKLTSYMEVDRKGQPTRSDYLLAFSCHRGYVSTRNEEEGSWLGASLAEHLMSQAHRKHLLEILNMVSRDVRRRKSADGLKQVLEITCIGFDRNLYFNPGLTRDNDTPQAKSEKN